ncbi:hypothetical protein ABZ413_18020 [Nocardia rhamnosiphila]|uniref:alpha/beta hydrolase family protein n=1 Tax=Nocardia rhamnosiphila TaxID=426716 RepID=UPI0033F7FE36
MSSIVRRIAFFAAVIAAVCYGIPAAHAQDDTTTVDITFTRGDGTTTTGTVHAPAGAAGRPGVVLVHGSGDGRSAHYDLTADAFARAGIVALAYDKRTEGTRRRTATIRYWPTTRWQVLPHCGADRRSIPPEWVCGGCPRAGGWRRSPLRDRPTRPS